MYLFAWLLVYSGAHVVVAAVVAACISLLLLCWGVGHTEALGYTPVVLTTRLDGEARDVAKALTAITVELADGLRTGTWYELADL